MGDSMEEIDVNNWNRKMNYEFFKTFSNSTYSMNVRMDVTKIVKYSKENDRSFFINMLYIVLKGLNNTSEMRMRLVNDKPTIYDDINPAFNVMTEDNSYVNVRFRNIKYYNEFYSVAHKYIENAKKGIDVDQSNYNPKDCYNEYYITCVPWVDIKSVTHPIPDDKASQCIPRICWGKYINEGDKYYLTLNITVSHIFVDGHPLSKVFNTIQEFLNKADEILK